MKKIIVAILMMMIEQASGWVHVTAGSNLYGLSALCVGGTAVPTLRRAHRHRHHHHLRHHHPLC